MIVVALLLVGACVGAVVAKRKNGNRLDMLQYAGVFAILFSIIGVFLTIVIERMF